VRLTGLSLRHFRNLGTQDLEIPPEGVALVGDNAQGKSNFLEAIYYLETLRSFRGARDDQLLGFGEDVFRVAGTLRPSDLAEDDEVQVSAAFQKTGRQKKVTIRGQEPERLTDGIGSLCAVIFSPADVAIVNEGPAERRRFLDIVLSLNATGYVEALQEYRHVLAQRNAALKEDRGAQLVELWDPALVRAGTKVMQERRSWTAGRADEFARYYAEVSGGQGASQSYRPSVSLAGIADDEVSGAFLNALQESRANEARQRTTVVGPHRDEVRFQLEGEDRELDARDYGSGGQRRTIALALRLVEASTIRDARGQEPIVLMDDAFAELDEGRSERIMQLIDREETGQVILTAPKEADVRLRTDALPRWTIAGGRISA